MKILGFVNNHFIWLMPLSIFVSALLPKLTYSTLSSELDAYYHHAHSLTYATGETFQYPVFSLVNVHQTDLWFLYHFILGGFIKLLQFGTIDPIVANKIFHALLATGVFVLIYLTARELARALAPWHKNLFSDLPYSAPLTPHVIGMLSVAFILLAPLHNTAFLYRIVSNERPHVFAIILTLGVVLALLRGRYWWLLLIGAVSALSYSFSLIILLPILAFFGTQLIFYRYTRVPITTSLLAVLVSTAGIAVGTLLHPSSYGYLIAGLGQTSFAIGHSLFSWTGWFGPGTILAPAEMKFMPSEISFGFGLMVCILIGLAYLSVILYRQSTYNFTLQSLVFYSSLLIGLSFTLLQVLIPRTVEYGLSFFTCTLAVIIGQLVWPHTVGYHQLFSSRVGELGDVYRKISHMIIDTISDNRLRLGFVLIGSLIIIFAPIANTTALMLLEKKFDDTMYKGITDYLSVIPNHTLLTEHFDVYPMLIYTSPKVAISTGLDSRFLHLYNPVLSDAVTLFWGHTLECRRGESVCTKTTGVLSKTLTDNRITHILVNEESVDDASFMTNLIANPDVRLVYRDERYSNLTLYEITL